MELVGVAKQECSTCGNPECNCRKCQGADKNRECHPSHLGEDEFSGGCGWASEAEGVVCIAYKDYKIK